MFRLCVIVSRDKKKNFKQCTVLETVLAETQKRCERKKGKKKADKLLKYRTVDNPVRENSSDDGIEICYHDNTTSW